MVDTIRLKFEPQEGKDVTEGQSVIDSQGYEWRFGPNETKVLPDENRQILASNATVKWGTSTRGEAPHVIADIEDNIGKI